MNNNIIPFIVEDGLHSSNIDSLFVSLFYKPSYIQNILSEYPENISFMYLQELIYENFVCNMRRNYFIDASIINEIRNYMVLCGWKTGADVMNTYDVQEVYSFLINGFYKNKLSFNVKNKSKTGADSNTLINMDYIELKVEENSCIKTLINTFSNSMSSFCFESIPNFIPIYLNRNFGAKNTRINNFFVDVKEGICLSKNNTNADQKSIWWKIHSLICYSGGEKGHYYSIVSDGVDWYLFNHFKLPSLLKIDIKNEDFASKIKQECVFIFYTLNA